MQVRSALDQARQQIDAIDARVLLQHSTGMSRAALQAHPERTLDEATCTQFLALVARRAAGEPVAYLTGQREFYGRAFDVDDAVLIPRPETEHLVEAAARVMAGGHAPSVLDLGTGSGVVAITLALLVPQAVVTAVDASAHALAVAQRNARRLDAAVSWVQSDWFAALGGQRFDVIVSNPPYIAAHDPHLQQGDLRFEPHTALTDGSVDGLASVRHIIAGAPEHLKPGGWLWLEHGFDQAAAIQARLALAGFEHVSSERDLAGIERVTGGQFPII